MSDPAEQIRLALFGRDVGLALNEHGSLRDMLARCCELTVERLGGAFARVWTLDEAGTALELRASAGLYTHVDGSHARVPLGRSKIGTIGRDRRPHLTNAVIGDPLVPAQEWAAREGMVAFAGYPLVVEDRLVGVWAMFARRPLSEATLMAMESVAAGIASAVERKRVEERLRAERERLGVTLASIGDGVIATDVEGRVAFLNPVAEALTGWPRDEAVGTPLGDVFRIVNEETRRPVECPAARALREGAVVGLANHTILIARDGRERAIDDSAAPIRDEAGSVIGAVLVFRDVEEKRRASRALEASEVRKASFLMTALDAIITIDHEGKVVEWNPAAESIFGIDRASAIGREMAEMIVPPALRDAHRRGMARFLATGEGPILGKRLEIAAVRADGSEFPVELTVAPIPSSVPPAFTAHVRDIAERKRAEADREQLLGKFEAERRHLRAIIDSSQDCLKELDLGGKLLSMNEAGRRLLGIADLRDVLDRPWPDFWRGEGRAMAERAVAAAAAGGVGAFEGSCPTLRGEPKWWDVRVTPILDGDGRPERLLAVSRDITERVRHAEERERLLAESQSANRAKDQFLAVLSHELRTPLNPILLAVSSMLERTPAPEDLRPNLEMIRQYVNLQARLIDDLLDVMRIVRGKMPLHWEVADCHTVIRHAVQVCQSEVFGKVIRLSLDLSAAHHHINADPTRLQQVFWNLIKNSVKFCAGGGTIAIRTRNVVDDGLGERLVIEVADDGIGIEPAVLPTIFDPFQQGETTITRRFGGLGLGLAISRGIVEGHGGSLTAESPGKGRGSTFRIELKALPAPRPEAEGPPTAEGGSPEAARRRHILLVEDEQATLRLMARLLEGLGHRVTTASTIASALEAVESGGHDLIVSDIVLPDGTGLDLMRRVVALRGPIPAIALTGYGMEEDIQRSRAAGFTAHMTKPIDFTKLKAMIQQIVASKPAGGPPRA